MEPSVKSSANLKKNNPKRAEFIDKHYRDLEDTYKKVDLNEHAKGFKFLMPDTPEEIVNNENPVAHTLFQDLLAKKNLDKRGMSPKKPLSRIDSLTYRETLQLSSERA